MKLIISMVIGILVGTIIGTTVGYLIISLFRKLRKVLNKQQKYLFAAVINTEWFIVGQDVTVKGIKMRVEEIDHEHGILKLKL